MIGRSEAAAIAAMRRQRGTEATLRRPVRGGSPIDVTVYATLRFQPTTDTTPAVSQANQVVKISDDLITVAGWPGPPRKGDQIIMRSQTFTVLSVDTVTMGDTVLSHRLDVRGAV